MYNESPPILTDVIIINVNPGTLTIYDLNTLPPGSC